MLAAGQNFGCGSSREHAPQALMRWGIGAIVGGSFGGIFFGNCVMLGIPCMVTTQADLEWLQKAISRTPQEPVTVDVDKQEVRFGDRVIKATMPDGPRNQLVAARTSLSPFLRRSFVFSSKAIVASPRRSWLYETEVAGRAFVDTT